MVLDAQALARLRELDPGGHAGVVRRVLQTYERSLDSTLERLSGMDPREELPELRRLVHTLKSSSASVGALELSAICAHAESLSVQARLDELSEVLVTLRAAALGAQQAVRAALGS